MTVHGLTRHRDEQIAWLDLSRVIADIAYLDRIQVRSVENAVAAFGRSATSRSSWDNFMVGQFCQDRRAAKKLRIRGVGVSRWATEFDGGTAAKGRTTALCRDSSDRADRERL